LIRLILMLPAPSQEMQPGIFGRPRALQLKRVAFGAARRRFEASSNQITIMSPTQLSP
jgi:hypothetical protein